MTILLVDDQRTILDGLLSGVPFDEIGFDRVLTASGTEEAWVHLNNETVDVLLTDIEMPGENGLELIRKASAAFPDILCIPLTSHADFEFAKESLRLGCFDYLVQPAPYEAVAECLRKAFDSRVRLAQQKFAQNLGSYVQRNEPGITGSTVMKLYSSDPGEVAEALQYLTVCGYIVERKTPASLCIVVDMPYLRRDPDRLQEGRIISAIRDSFSLSDGHPVPLITRNRYRQFVILLCHPDGLSDPPCADDTFRQALDGMTSRLGNEPALYVGPVVTIGTAREAIPGIHVHIDNNVSERTGIIKASSPTVRQAAFFSAADNIPRWRALIERDRYDILSREIRSYLDGAGGESQDLRGLSDLHQQLTQTLFEHLRSRNIDIMSLFDPDHTYAMYMDSFRTVSSFRDSFIHLLDAAASSSNIVIEQSDVDRAKAYIFAHLDQPLLVTDVAAHVNLSSEYFTKLFKKETGQNIKDFITQAKINAARELLASSDIPVSLVAMEMGYDNFSHFTQIFRKICGVTPSEYRREKRGERG